jgi:hypothetical protein
MKMIVHCIPLGISPVRSVQVYLTEMHLLMHVESVQVILQIIQVVFLIAKGLLDMVPMIIVMNVIISLIMIVKLIVMVIGVEQP